MRAYPVSLARLGLGSGRGNYVARQTLSLTFSDFGFLSHAEREKE